MKIGIVSDTHSLVLPDPLLKAFKSVDLIIHSGDICDAQTLKSLQALGPVKAVQGNMDDPDLKKKLPVCEIIEVEGVRIGVTHGHVGDVRDAMTNAKALFKDETLDIVIYGHSHLAFNEKIGKTLYFNPGSPNDVVKAKFFSYGLIDVNNGRINAQVIKI